MRLYLHPVRVRLQTPAFATAQGPTKGFSYPASKGCASPKVGARYENENVGIKINHLAFAPRDALAPFIAAIVTGKAGLRTSPFKAVAD